MLRPGLGAGGKVFSGGNAWSDACVAERGGVGTRLLGLHSPCNTVAVPSTACIACDLNILLCAFFTVMRPRWLHLTACSWSP